MQPFVGEIRMFGGNFAPLDWAFCDGSPLPISTYQTLFSLIGTTYGGDGQSTFNLPDLRSRVPVHQGPGYVIGLPAGAETVSLTGNEMPQHSHILAAGTPGGAVSPVNALFGPASSTQPGTSIYGTGSASLTTLSPLSIQPSGGGQAHDNIQPYVCITFIIALFGIYPTQG